MNQKKLLPPEEIARRLKDRRGSRSNAEISEATGIGVSALNNYEAALRIPRDEAKAALAEYYHCTVDDLFFTSGATKRDEYNTVSGGEIYGSDQDRH